MDETWFSKLQKLIVFGTILLIVVVIGPQLNEYRKVISAVKESTVEAAKFSTSQEVKKSLEEKLENLGVKLNLPNIEVVGKGSDTEISIEYRKTISISSKMDLAIDYKYPFSE